MFITYILKIIACFLFSVPCLLPLMLMYSPQCYEKLNTALGEYFTLYKVAAVFLVLIGAGNFVRMYLKLCG